MTALMTPAEPSPQPYPRSVPWRGMNWITWRQHRAALAALAAVLGAAGLYLYITGLDLRHDVAASGEMFTANGSGKMGMTLTAALFQVLPALIGAFVGAPVLARELETGTYRYTWTQGFGRERWATAKLAQIAVAVTVIAGAFGFLFSWCYEPIIGVHQGLSPLMAITFDLRGVAFAAWALVAFAIGVLAGILIRRVIPAMFASLAAWSGLAVVTGAPGVFGPTSGSASGPTSGNSAAFGPGGAWRSAPTYLSHHGFTQLTSYQPASRFWPFQWIEGGWLLALSVLLFTVTIWLVRRHAA
jgi:hypothetical protein